MDIPQSSPTPLPEQPVTPQVEGVSTPAEQQLPAVPVEAAPQPGPGVSAPPVVAVPLVPPAPSPLPSQPVAPPVQVPITGPAIADDVDVIEKEWVDKATGIIHATSTDPYVEEEAIEDLQVDYLKKRYGKEVKKDQTPPPSTPPSGSAPPV